MRSSSPLATLLMFGLLVYTSPAHAQDAKPAAGAKSGAPFDAASLDAALKGMRAFKTKIADAAAAESQLADAQRKITTIRGENQSKVDNYMSTRDAISQCLRAFGSTRTGDRASRIQRKVMAIMSDQPALDKFSTDYARLAATLDSATARKDSAAMNKLNDDINALLTLDAKADSIAGAKKCGVLPPKPPAVAQMDEVQGAADGFTRQIKLVEAAADSAGARAAAVPPARFTQMRERLSQFIANDSTFADKEGELLKARRAEIETALKRS